MTQVATLTDTVIVDAPVRQEAEQILAQAADEPIGAFSVSIHGRSVQLPAELSEFMRRILERTAQGGSTTMRSMPEELTTTAAAALLGISRPTLMKMIAEGQIAAMKVGTHNRLLATDVFAFLDQRRTDRAAALDALRDFPDGVGGI